jgi:hypothetical protein
VRLLGVAEGELAQLVDTVGLKGRNIGERLQAFSRDIAIVRAA